MNISEDNFPDELVLRFEPHGEVLSFLFHWGDCLDSAYEKQSNEITLKPDVIFHTNSQIAGDGIVIGLYALNEKGLVKRIGEFLDSYREKLWSFFLLWSYAEDMEVDSVFPGVSLGKIVSQDDFEDGVKLVHELIDECRGFAEVIEFSGYLSQRASIKLNLNIEHHKKTHERKQKNLNRRRRKNFTKAEYIKLGERNGYQCSNCGSNKQLEIDHIHPLSKGGSDDFDNLQLLCKQCNISKSDKLNNEQINLDTSIKDGLKILDELINKKFD